MRKRRAWRLAAGVLLAGGLALLIPGTPLYLPNWFVPRAQYEGRTARSWLRDLTDAAPQVRRRAAHALGMMGPDAGEAAPALAGLLVRDSDRDVRVAASLALSKLDPESPELAGAVSDLAKALKDDDPAVRCYAAMALLRLGPRARPAGPALAEALRDEANQTNAEIFHFTMQELAALALAQSGSPEALPALTTALVAARTEQLRRTVLRALGESGESARSAVPHVRAYLRDNSDEVRKAAAEALTQIEGKTSAPAETENALADLQLPEAERKYLWDIEHHGNLLVKHGFGPLAAAIKNADAAALTRQLAESFAGADMREPRRVRAAAGFAEVERSQDAGNPPLPLDRDAFVARLLSVRKLFAGSPQVKLALMNLGPKRRGQLDGPWEGTAQLRLNGEHAKGAPAEAIVWLRYELSRPTEETLARPGWLRFAAVQQTLTSKAPHYLFADVTRQRGLEASRLHDNWKSGEIFINPGGVYVCDFDRDGILDVLVTDITGNTLYRGRRDGTFEDVTERFGLPRQARGSTAAAWMDIDGDGWEDLILGGKVFRNVLGRRFEDYSSRCNLVLPRDASALLVADYDRDGKLDLYVTRAARPGKRSWLEGKSADSLGNFLFRNRGGWQFEDVTAASGASGGYCSTFTAAWLDADNDGWPDLHVLNEFGDGVLLVNNRDGTFRQQPLADRPADFGSMGIAVGDVNNDGHIDIYCANMYSKAGTRVIANLAPDTYPAPVLEKMRRFVAGSQLHLNKGGLKFEQAGALKQLAGVGWAYGACLADLDNDGWLDVYATAGFVSRNRDEPDG